MEVKAFAPDPNPTPRLRKTPVSMSRWINERNPPLHELLSAHDVVRLTRRPRWVIAGLCLIGRFPKKLKFRGRAIGWRRSDVLEWLARDITAVGDHAPAIRSESCRRPRHILLPLKRAASNRFARRCRARRRSSKCKASPRIC